MQKKWKNKLTALCLIREGQILEVSVSKDAEAEVWWKATDGKCDRVRVSV